MTRWLTQLCACTSILVAPSVVGSAHQRPHRIVINPVWQSTNEALKVEIFHNSAFVLSAADHNVTQVDLKSGQIRRRIGGIGMGPGDIYLPIDLSLSPSGRYLWVADRGNGRVSRFSEGGEFEGSFPLKAPISIAAINDDTVAVVGTWESTLMKVMRIDGSQLVAGGEPVATQAGSPEQNAYFNRGFVVTDGDTLLFAFRSLLTPLLRRYSIDRIRPLMDVRIDGTLMPEVIQKARPILDKAAAEGRYSYGSTLTGIAINPATQRIFVMTAAPIVYELEANGKRISEYQFVFEDGTPVAPTNIEFEADGRAGVMVVGRRCFRFKIL